MFKIFAVVFAAILALAAAAPKPGLLATPVVSAYTAPVVAPTYGHLGYSGYVAPAVAAPVQYSAGYVAPSVYGVPALSYY